MITVTVTDGAAPSAKLPYIGRRGRVQFAHTCTAAAAAAAATAASAVAAATTLAAKGGGV